MGSAFVNSGDYLEFQIEVLSVEDRVNPRVQSRSLPSFKLVDRCRALDPFRGTGSAHVAMAADPRHPISVYLIYLKVSM